MQTAPTHTIPVRLFELHHGDKTTHDSDSDTIVGDDDVSANIYSAGGGIDRFGPGRLSRRHNNTKRLRKLRARRPACPVNDPVDCISLSRGSTGVKKSAQERMDCAVNMCSRASKRHRASPGGACPIGRKRPPPEHSSLSVQPMLPQEEALPGRITTRGAHASQSPIREEDGRPKDNCDAWCSGADASTAAYDRPSGKAENAGHRHRVDDSKVQVGPVESLDDAPSIGSGSTTTIGARGLSQILPVRSSPAPWRPRATSIAKSTNSRSGSSQTQLSTDREAQQQQHSRKHVQADAAAPAVRAARAAGPAATGDTNTGGWGSVVANETQGFALAEKYDIPHNRSFESSTATGSGYPAVADTCGGIVLRMTPAERSLEPWGTTLAPLRAMCDIEPSLSRAGIEYRGVVHAVGEAQEMKSHHEIKQRKARDAKALLGKDVRPRTSEPRMSIAGVTTELDVLKAIIVRERLIVTLRRLIRRLRRHCSRLQEFLRREVKFRWRHGKPPPEALVCVIKSARLSHGKPFSQHSRMRQGQSGRLHEDPPSGTTVVTVPTRKPLPRKTLHMEQQELRVVLAHLRAISFDTVKAVTDWRATFLALDKPRYRQVSRNGPAPPVHHMPTRSSCSADPLGKLRNSYAAGNIREGGGGVDQHDGKDAAAGYRHLSPDDFQAGQEDGGEAGTRHHDKDSGSFGRGDSETSSSGMARRAQTANSHERSNGRPAAIFLWKGQNYLIKMSRDLEFLDDVRVAAPVSSWLGFRVRGNPFLIPPEGHDVCRELRLEYEERRKAAAARRRQRPANHYHQHHRLPGGHGVGKRRASRSRSRSRTGTGINGGDASSRRPSEQQQEEGEQEKTAQPPAYASAKGGERLQATGLAATGTAARVAVPGGEEEAEEEGRGATFVTEGGAAAKEVSIGSAATSVEPPLRGGLEGFEDDAIPCELSSGEEEEVLWSGGGQLSVPIIPDLPEAVRSKVSAAAEVLRGEGASEKIWESNAREVLANARRTREILHQPGREQSARVESLAARSSKEGLKGALVDRHVGAMRLRPAASMVELSAWEDGPLVRRASTAPARGAGAPRRSRGIGFDAAAASAAPATSAKGMRRDQDQRSPAFGSNARGGVCVAVDGEMEVGQDNGRAKNAPAAAPSPARPHRTPAAVGSQASTVSRRGGGSAISSRSRRRDRPATGGAAATVAVAAAAAVSEGSIDGASTPSLAERSMASSSLQASSSSMSARARARAVATRPTAMRRPFCLGVGGKIVISDPGQSPKVRHRAATRIQAVMLSMMARRVVHQLREDRERAALLIGRNWRTYRVRLGMWKARRSRRAEELRQLAVDRLRDRGAYLIQTFCRDIKYRRKRDQMEQSLKMQALQVNELREKGAATTLQAVVRRFNASTRVRRIRHRRRGQAQARIARAARQRAAYVRQRELEGQGREESDVASSAMTMAIMRIRPSLQPDEAAIRIQAWLRGSHCRGTTVAAAIRAKEETKLETKVVYAPGSKSAHLQAALDALQAAHAAMKRTSHSEKLGSKVGGQDARRRTVADKSSRSLKGGTDVAGSDFSPSSPPRVDERRREARVAERRNTPSRVSPHLTSPTHLR